MNEMLATAKNQTQQFWGNLSKGQKLTFGIVLGLLLSGSVFLAFSVLRTEYTEVARDLDPRDASEIVEMIEEQGISYQIEDGGTRVLVPERDHEQVRLDLAGAGLPRGGVLGYEDMDTSQLGLTESEREMREKIALEGELVRTIRRYPEVEDARVHLVLPEQSVFEEAREDSQAAVFLELGPQRELTQQQITSIVNLIAHSVEGLTSENVTLTSGDQILSDDIRSDEDSTTGGEVKERLSIQDEFQNTLQNSVESMLEDVLGQGNVSTNVTAELNFDDYSTFSELFEPVEGDEGILVSVHEEEELYSGEGMGPGGIPGDPADGTPEYPEEAKDGGEFEYERTDETRNYEVNRIEERHKVAPGAVDQLSVAVAVNQDLDDNEMESIENLVQDSIGADLDRDQISVEQMDFDTTLEGMLAEQHEKEQELAARQQWRNIAIAAVVILILLFVARRIYKGVQAKREREARQEQERIAREQAAASQEDMETEVPETQKQITNFAEKKPEEFAKVLKAWLAED